MWDAYLQPTGVEEALGLLQRYGGHARIVAGGTDVLVELPRGAAELRSSRARRARGGRPTATLIDVTRLPVLKYVRDYGRCIRLDRLPPMSERRLPGEHGAYHGRSVRVHGTVRGRARAADVRR